MKHKRGVAKVIAAIVGFSAACGHAHADEGWDWMVEPYLWAASIDTDLRTFQPPTDAESDTSFADVVHKLDGVLLVRVEGRGDRFGAFADFTYLGLGDDNHRRVMSTETDLDTRLLDAAVSWRPGGLRGEGFDVYAGIRYIDVDLTVQFKPDDPAFAERKLDNGRNYTDFLAGVRYTWQFEGNWGLTLSGDVSGGDTEGSWSAAAIGHYRTGNGLWLFGYRYLEVELGNGSLETTITMSGPHVGYGFTF